MKPSTMPLELVGTSAAVERLQELVRRAALAEGGVLIVADCGTDAEPVARHLHERRRPTAAYVQVPCTAADPRQLEGLLFGTRSASTPADLECVASSSSIAAARNGTLFLQDVGEVPAALQARLARVAGAGEVRLEGVTVETNLRLVASAAPGIDAEVHANQFRSDLYRRLAMSRLDLAPLRDRPEDVPTLAARLLADWCAARGLAPRTFAQPALALLSALTWPGNLAELRLLVARTAEGTPHDVIQIEDVLPALSLNRAPARFEPSGHLRAARLRFERTYISAVLLHHGWRMAEAAETLGIQRPNLYRKARQLGIPLTRASE